MKASFAVLVITLSIGKAFAVDPTQLPNSELQARYSSLTHELRCVKCQNQSIADSPAGLATDLRSEVRDMLLQGKSDDEVRDYMVARYGEFILFRPRLSLRNAWLWFLPLALLLLGAFVAVRVIRQRAALVEQDETPIEESSSRE
jgi:cytochrome c-type biogenesis protein CcmH